MSPVKNLYFDMKNVITAGTLCAVSVMLLALYFRSPEDELQVRLKNVLSGLITIDQRYETCNPRIAVGYGSCKDIVFDGRDILDFEHRSESEFDVDEIKSYDDLLKAYTYYFKYGAAAERFTSNGTLFNELVMRTNGISARVNIGGNAASIAKRFALEGFDVLLATSASSSSAEMLPSNMEIAGEVTSHDDIHLVFEYKAKEQWGSVVAPRANRFILHHDYHNPRISSLELFGLKLEKFNPQLFVVSGLQMMDNYPLPETLKERRLEKVRYQMTSQSRSTKIHFEMASITEKNLLSRIFDYVVPFADSLGMNEQELANMHSLLKHKTITRAVDSNPKIGKTLDMMRQIYSYLQEMTNTTHSSRSLSRLHVHTLAFQLIMIRKDSDWKNTHVAAARASLVANTYVCDTSEVDIEKSKLVMDESFSVSSIPGSRRIYLDDHEPVACWDENFYHICIAPNLVCTNAKQTAGCGDNISAAGLAAQL